MNDSLPDALEWAVSQYASGSRLALLFDYDGALTEFAETPDRARLAPETSRAIEDLVARPGVIVGVISGRELGELKQMVGIPGLFYAGTCGLELEFRDRTVTHPLVQHSLRLLAEVAAALEPHVSEFPDAWIERKRFGLTVHYRKLDPQVAARLHGRIESELAHWGDRLHVVTGAKAVEITPEIGWTKGTAVEFLLESLGPDPCLLLYAGNEANDVEPLWRVGAHRGIAIGVGDSPPTTAQFKVADSRAVRHLLDNLCHALGEARMLQEQSAPRWD